MHTRESYEEANVEVVYTFIRSPCFSHDSAVCYFIIIPYNRPYVRVITFASDTERDAAGKQTVDTSLSLTLAWV